MNGNIEIEEISHSRRTCSCVPKCTQYFKIYEFDVYCKKMLEQLAVDIFNTVNGISISNKNYRSHGWTTGQEKQLIQYMENNVVRNGTYRILGEMLGKSREQVKNKVYMMEKAGRIKRYTGK